MTQLYGVDGVAVVDVLPTCKYMQSGGAFCAGLLYGRGGKDAHVGRQVVMLLSSVFDVPVK